MRESGAKEGRRLRRTAPGVVALGLGILVACLLLEEPQAAPRARAERREGAAPSLRAALVLEAVASTSSRPSSGAAAIAAVASRDLVATRLVWPAAIAGAPALPGMPSAEESPLLPGLDRISLHGVVSSVGGTVPRAFVKLVATISWQGGHGEEDEHVRDAVLVRTPPEWRPIVASVLSSGRAIVELGTAEAGQGGRFDFMLDRALLPEDAQLWIVAEAPRYGGRSVAVSGCCTLPERNEDGSSERIDLGTFELRDEVPLSIHVEAGGRAVAGAAVVVDDDTPLTGATDARGFFELATVSANRTVSVSVDGFATEVCALAPGQDALSVSLSTEHPVSVRVVDSNGLPASATLDALLDNVGAGHASSGKDGTATLHGLATGRRYTLYVDPTSPDLVPTAVEIEPPCDLVSLRLEGAATLSVKLAFDETIPSSVAAEAEVRATLLRLLPAGGWEVVTQADSSDHALSFSRIRPGTYRVATQGREESHHLALAYSADVVVRPSREPIPVAIAQGMGRRVGGWVVDEEGRKIPFRATVSETMTSLGGGNEAGWLEARLPNGPVHLELGADGFADATVLVPADVSRFGPIVLKGSR